MAVNFKTQYVNRGLIQKYAIVDHTLIFKANFYCSTRINAQGIGFYILLAAHLSIILDNDQLDTHLLYFTIRLL